MYRIKFRIIASIQLEIGRLGKAAEVHVGTCPRGFGGASMKQARSHKVMVSQTGAWRRGDVATRLWAVGAEI